MNLRGLFRSPGPALPVKRFVRPMPKLKSFRCARAIIAGIETMHMIKKGQLDFAKDRTSPADDRFYSLAF